MPTSILTTKIYIPLPPTNLVPRPRLVEKLNQSTNHRLTLISAPAGFGKTTLLSEYVSICKEQVAWVSLDEGDNEVPRLFIHIIAALQTIEPQFGVGLLEILASSQQIPIESVLTDLINQTSKISDKFILVLDDYHIINSNEIDKALLFFLDHMSAKMRLVISSRTDPTLPLPRLRACGHLAELRADDLRFTSKEAATFLGTAMGIETSAENIAALEKRTEGWIAGLQLAALSMQGLSDPKDASRFVKNFSSSHRYILDYLTDEVLEQRPEGTRDFLIQTSILSKFNASLCQAVTNSENSQYVLETLDATNLFLIPLDNERGWYRYHHLFGDLLQKRLMLLQPEIVANLHLRAAEWFTQHELISEALSHFMAAEEFDRAADLVEQKAKERLERSELATLMSWVDALPEALVCSRPWLCVYHAWALRLSGARFDAVESRIEAAKIGIRNYELFKHDLNTNEELLRHQRQIEKLQGHILALQSFQNLYKEDIPSTLRLTQQAQKYEIDENFVRASISFARGWALRFSGDLESAYQAFTETTKFSLASGNIFLAVAATCRAAYGHVLGGELREAEKIFQEAVDLATINEDEKYPVAGYAYVYLGGIHYEWNNLAAAKQYLIEGIEYCARVGYYMDQVVGLVALAQVNKILGDWNAVQDAIAKAENLSNAMKSYIYVRRWVDNTRIRLWYAQSDWEQIFQWTQNSGMTIADDLEYNRDLEHVVLARALVYLGLNQPADYARNAQILLNKLLEKAEAANWGGKVIEILVLQALVFQALGDDQSAHANLEQAITRAEPEDYIRTFIDEGEPMHKLIVEVRERISLRAGVKPLSTIRYIDRILAECDRENAAEQRNRLNEGPFHERHQIIEPLSDREREVLCLLADGKTNQEIALALVIAVSTAKKHVSNIIGKLGVSNRTQAVARARELNLF